MIDRFSPVTRVAHLTGMPIVWQRRWVRGMLMSGRVLRDPLLGRKVRHHAGQILPPLVESRHRRMTSDHAAAAIGAALPGTLRFGARHSICDDGPITCAQRGG